MIIQNILEYPLTMHLQWNSIAIRNNNGQLLLFVLNSYMLHFPNFIYIRCYKYSILHYIEYVMQAQSYDKPCRIRSIRSRLPSASCLQHSIGSSSNTVQWQLSFFAKDRWDVTSSPGPPVSIFSDLSWREPSTLGSTYFYRYIIQERNALLAGIRIPRSMEENVLLLYAPMLM